MSEPHYSRHERAMLAYLQEQVNQGRHRFVLEVYEGQWAVTTLGAPTIVGRNLQNSAAWLVMKRSEDIDEPS